MIVDSVRGDSAENVENAKIRLPRRALQRCLKSNTHVSLKTLNVFVIIYKAEQPVRIATVPARVRCRFIRGV